MCIVYLAVECPSMITRPNTIVSSDTTQYGTTLYYTCVEGYLSDGGLGFTSMCDATASWTNQHLNCRGSTYQSTIHCI